MSKTVLVVDDEMLIALDIQSQLEDLRHKALVATTVGEAVALVGHEHFDAAIVDWHLRDELSAPLTDLLQQRQIPFVLCTGSALEELAGLFPGSTILMKPFASGDLIGALNQLIDQELLR